MHLSREDAKRIADRASDFFDRCIARGKSRDEATELTVAFLLSLHHDAPESVREAWREPLEDDEP